MRASTVRLRFRPAAGGRTMRGSDGAVDGCDGGRVCVDGEALSVGPSPREPCHDQSHAEPRSVLRRAHLVSSHQATLFAGLVSQLRVEPTHHSPVDRAPSGGDVLARLPAVVSAQLRDPQRLAAQLEAWYVAPTRHYHGLAHLLAFLACWEDAIASAVPGALDDPVTFAGALLLHDAIYDVRRTDNEAA